MKSSFCCILMILLGAAAVLAPVAGYAKDEPGQHFSPIQLRAFGVPTAFGLGPAEDADRHVIEAFRQKYPHVEPVSIKGITIPGGTHTENMVPFMQIAGNIAPDVMYVNFKQSQTYIDMKLLCALDAYVEALAGVTLGDGSAMTNAEYVAALSQGAGWDVLEDRVPPQCWEVMRRECPYGRDCAHRSHRSLEPLEHHHHVWAFPVGPLVMGLSYDRTMFAEHAAQGIEQRAPRDWDELVRWARILTNPPRNEYGLAINADTISWHFLSFLYSAGGRVVEQDESGEWRCVLDSEAAVEALYFYARLRLEKVVRDGREYRGVIALASGQTAPVRHAMSFVYLDDRFLAAAADQTRGIAPVPAGPTGLRGSEFNAMMCGIYSGLVTDDARRDAAWNYIHFFDGPEARRIRVEKMVEAGLGPFVRRRLLERFNDGGRYDAMIRRVPAELEQTYSLAFAGGVPEPYGRNCQYVYEEMNKPIGTVWNSLIVRNAIDRNDPEAAKREIRLILQRATARINERMLGHLPPDVERRRSVVSWVVIALVAITFAVVVRKVLGVFSGQEPSAAAGARRRRVVLVALLLAPALLSLALWMYWPLARGTIIAFQDYAVTGESTWVGAANFANVLHSPEFWHSMLISLIYTILFLFLGFWTPIALALLLQEIPWGKTTFRVLYYLPAVLSGVIVIFLWRSFYAPGGLIVQLVHQLILLANLLPGVGIAQVNVSLLDDPRWALLLTLIPVAWAGLGPGSLIYLAALKTVPNELYEAADIDGAGVARKVFSVALPSIRALITINLIGAIIGAVRGAGMFVLAMTGGGPFTEAGGATEVVGLRIFYTTFGYLQFGPAAAMAWVVGSMLIGFTVFQLQRLAKLEFRTAGGAA